MSESNKMLGGLTLNTDSIKRLLKVYDDYYHDYQSPSNQSTTELESVFDLLRVFMSNIDKDAVIYMAIKEVNTWGTENDIPKSL